MFQLNFFVDDLTNLKHIKGPFDFLVDYGTFDDLNPSDRVLYIKNILPLTQKGTTFLFFCFEWPLQRWDRLMMRIPIFGAISLDSGEVVHRFGKYFRIEQINVEKNNSIVIPRVVTYLMTRI